MAGQLVDYYSRYLTKYEEESPYEFRLRIADAQKYVRKAVGTLKAVFINYDINKLTRGSIIKDII